VKPAQRGITPVDLIPEAARVDTAVVQAELLGCDLWFRGSAYSMLTDVWGVRKAGAVSEYRRRQSDCGQS